MSDPNILLMQYIEVIKRQLREQMSEQVGVKERTKEIGIQKSLGHF